MQVSYKNEYGTLDFKGGGTQEKLRILQIEGLGPPKQDFNVTGYAWQPGQELISKKDLARTITLSVDIAPVQSSLQYEIKRMSKILYRAGTLTIHSNGFRRSIPCRCTNFDEPERHGKEIAHTVLQFVCDNPYFTDERKESASLYYATNLLKTTFTLPCTFSERVYRVNVINSGDVKTEPVFYIYTNASTGASDNYGIKIINHTTGQSIMLEHYMADGETITIDIPNRKITSTVSGDIISSMSQDTFLSKFWLTPGNNDIEVVDSNDGERISVVAEYVNKYIEAVY